jgi:hypothetical protein
MLHAAVEMGLHLIDANSMAIANVLIGFYRHFHKNLV